MKKLKRILIVDDNESIHEDFRKILNLNNYCDNVDNYQELEDELFGKEKTDIENDFVFEYRLDFAFQGDEAIEKVKISLNENDPYALIFVDIRMPPGIDGIETIKKIRDLYFDVEIVVCSAYSDYSWEEIVKQLGITDKLLFLKKPFDSVEVKQMTLSLTTKWDLFQKSKNYVSDLEKEVSKRTKQLKGMVQELISNRDQIKREFFVREKTEINLEKDREMLDSILDSLSTPMIVLDNEMNVIWINKRVEEVLEITSDDILEKKLDSLFYIYDNNDTSIEININNQTTEYFEEKERVSFILKNKKKNTFIKIDFIFSKLISKNNQDFGTLIKLKDSLNLNSNKKNSTKEIKNMISSLLRVNLTEKNPNKKNIKDNHLENDLLSWKDNLDKSKKKDIYIVENDFIVKNTLKTLFNELNYNATFIEYKDLINNKSFSENINDCVVILDSMLFNQNNDFEYIKDLKNSNNNYKIVLLTGIHNKYLISNY